jgi:hypothetical protein
MYSTFKASASQVSYLVDIMRRPGSRVIRLVLVIRFVLVIIRTFRILRMVLHVHGAPILSITPIGSQEFCDSLFIPFLACCTYFMVTARATQISIPIRSFVPVFTYPTFLSQFTIVSLAQRLMLFAHCRRSLVAHILSTSDGVCGRPWTVLYRLAAVITTVDSHAIVSEVDG